MSCKTVVSVDTETRDVKNRLNAYLGNTDGYIILTSYLNQPVTCVQPGRDQQRR